jgi:CoA-dependent NAD(P)H sulfur oxidoreductase
MSQKKNLVVIGGVAAGLSAASHVKRRRPDIEVLVFEKSPHASYGSCGLPYLIEGLVEDSSELIALPIEELREKRGLDVRVLNEATGLDIEDKKVIVRDIQSGREFYVQYDWLVISTGASAIVPSFPGVDAEGVFTLRTLEDGIELEAYIKKESPKRAVIVGGGYIGMEMAEAFSARGLEVTVIEKLPRVLINYDREISESVREKLIEKDINLT